LERRGFVARDDYRRHDNIALTAARFAEACRLGGVRQSKIVDLERVQANWRAIENFALGYRHYLGREDGPPEDRDPETGFKRRVVGKFDHVST
jgi:hypothetical protein